jgi:hypothetical protein
MVIDTARRPALHEKMVNDPQRAVQLVFGITRHSHTQIVQRVFEQCASQTGSTLSVQTGIADFRAKGIVPAFVLQCCSFDAVQNSIDF